MGLRLGIECAARLRPSDPLRLGCFSLTLDISLFSAIGIFGAFFLLLLIVADVIPQALTSIPVFGRYLLANMVLVVLAMFLSTIATTLHGYPEDTYVPKCVERVRGGNSISYSLHPKLGREWGLLS